MKSDGFGTVNKHNLLFRIYVCYPFVCELVDQSLTVSQVFYGQTEKQGLWTSTRGLEI